MYTAYICNQILNENIYDIKYPLSDLEDYIEKYNLIKKNIVKEYWHNNVMILFNQYNDFEFKYIEDISVKYDSKRKVLIQEYIQHECIPYQFHKVDNEEIYTLYENSKDDIHIKLKKYKGYFTVDITSNELNNII
jgi:hypothetical protein